MTATTITAVRKDVTTTAKTVEGLVISEWTERQKPRINELLATLDKTDFDSDNGATRAELLIEANQLVKRSRATINSCTTPATRNRATGQAATPDDSSPAPTQEPMPEHAAEPPAADVSTPDVTPTPTRTMAQVPQAPEPVTQTSSVTQAMGAEVASTPASPTIRKEPIWKRLLGMADPATA